MKIGILASHPIQYQAPLFRELAHHVDLKVYFAHRQTAQGQAEAGFDVAFEWDVELLCGYEHRFLNNRAKKPGVSHFFGCDTPEIAEEIHTGGFDAFLVMGWYLKSFWQAMRACRRHGVPVMVRGDSQLGTPRGWLKQVGKKIIYPRVLGQFDACLYVGKRNREYLEHYGVAAERLFFSPHCIDNEAFSKRAREADRTASRGRLNIAPSQKAVLFVGKMLDVKRPLDLVYALHKLRDRGENVCGVIVGDGPLRGALEEEARTLHVPVAFLGFRNQTELPNFYAMSDVLVLPSESETWGLVVNESLACDTPVVVSDAVGCVPDLVLESQTGATYPAGNIPELANALQRVLASPPSCDSMKAVSDAYSVSAAARGVLEASNWLVRAGKGGRA